jgi:hypothetical protein
MFVACYFEESDFRRKGDEMKSIMPITALTLIVGLIASSPGAAHRTLPQHAVATSEQTVITRSVIKVHTDHGVITMPGVANTWDEAERAQFLAEGIADSQMVNNQNPIRLTPSTLRRH